VGEDLLEVDLVEVAADAAEVEEVKAKVEEVEKAMGKPNNKSTNPNKVSNSSTQISRATLNMEGMRTIMVRNMATNSMVKKVTKTSINNQSNNIDQKSKLSRLKLSPIGRSNILSLNTKRINHHILQISYQLNLKHLCQKQRQLLNRSSRFIFLKVNHSSTSSSTNLNNKNISRSNKIKDIMMIKIIMPSKITIKKMIEVDLMITLLGTMGTSSTKNTKHSMTMVLKTSMIQLLKIQGLLIQL
jgi:hypothetical protein